MKIITKSNPYDPINSYTDKSELKNRVYLGRKAGLFGLGQQHAGAGGLAILKGPVGPGGV